MILSHVATVSLKMILSKNPDASVSAETKDKKAASDYIDSILYENDKHYNGHWGHDPDCISL